jgi:hypothetical protein
MQTTTQARTSAADEYPGHLEAVVPLPAEEADQWVAGQEKEMVEQYRMAPAQQQFRSRNISIQQDLPPSLHFQNRRRPNKNHQ